MRARSFDMFSRSSVLLPFCGLVAALAAPPAWPREAVDEAVEGQPVIDYSGSRQTGQASYYGAQFARRTMADGTPLNLQSNAAASRTLPLGTRVRVTNLRNGRSAVVRIRDRGPYVQGRIIDLTPKTARRLGMRTAGVVPVEVAPLRIPQPDGSVRLGGAGSPAERREPFG